MIKHDNIVYVREINPIGGVETYVYELVKKYRDYDIAVVCRKIDKNQKRRIQKYCKVYEFKNEPIECKVCVINWDTSILDYVKAEKVYQGIHADYTHPSQGKVPEDDRITEYLGITEDVKRNFIKLTGRKNVRLCRNPLELEEDEKPLILVSPTRLTKEKGGDMMLKIANALEKQERAFIWFVLTTEEYLDNPIFMNKNVIRIPNRLDVGTFLSIADWVVMPSECEGDSYTIREALYRGIPVIVRHLKYFDEYGIEDGVNALFVEESNIEEVAKKMDKQLKFTFKPIEDGYREILAKGKSHYKQDLEKSETLKCTYVLGVDLVEEGYHIKEGETLKCTKDRAEELLETGCFELL